MSSYWWFVSSTLLPVYGSSTVRRADFVIAVKYEHYHWWTEVYDLPHTGDLHGKSKREVYHVFAVNSSCYLASVCLRQARNKCKLTSGKHGALITRLVNCMNVQPFGMTFRLYTGLITLHACLSLNRQPFAEILDLFCENIFPKHVY